MKEFSSPSFWGNGITFTKIRRRGDQADIIDDIHFEGRIPLLTVLMYPLLYLQFLYRKPIYRRYFNAMQLQPEGEEKMKILLTGANGYIGKRLLPALVKDGHEVVCLVRNKNRLNFPISMNKKYYRHPGRLIGLFLSGGYSGRY